MGMARQLQFDARHSIGQIGLVGQQQVKTLAGQPLQIGGMVDIIGRTDDVQAARQPGIGIFQQSKSGLCDQLGIDKLSAAAHIVVAANGIFVFGLDTGQNGQIGLNIAGIGGVVVEQITQKKDGVGLDGIDTPDKVAHFCLVLPHADMGIAKGYDPEAALDRRRDLQLGGLDPARLDLKCIESQRTAKQRKRQDPPQQTKQQGRPPSFSFSFARHGYSSGSISAATAFHSVSMRSFSPSR